MHGDAGIIHVTWGSARAESIRDALRLLGHAPLVVGLSKDLALGPIDPPDPNLREAWIRSILRCPTCEDLYEEEEPWTRATSSDVRPVFWMFRSDAAEHSSFLEFAFRMPDRSLDIVDATGLDFVTERGVRMPWSLGLMSPNDIVGSGLYDRRRPLSPAGFAAATERWSRLRGENAPLRIVKDNSLVSAPLTHFDAFLSDRATPEWEVAARLIGRTMSSLAFDIDPPGQSPSHLVLFGRILALGESGVLEVSGPGPGMRDYKVRRSDGRQAA